MNVFHSFLDTPHRAPESNFGIRHFLRVLRIPSSSSRETKLLRCHKPNIRKVGRRLMADREFLFHAKKTKECEDFEGN